MNQVENIIGQEAFTVIKAEFFKDIDEKRIRVEPVTPYIITTAVELLKETYITPIDSMQPATMAILYEQLEEVVFLCSDRKLVHLAEKKDM